MVLPCVPPTAIDHFSRISSASISARRTTGISRARAAAHFRIVALHRGRDDDHLRVAEIGRRRGRSRPGCRPRAAAGHWRCRRCRCPARCSRALCSTSAMPDMPMPPMPTKWMVPMESGKALMRRAPGGPRGASAFRRGRPGRRRRRGGPACARPRRHAASSRRCEPGASAVRSSAAGVKSGCGDQRHAPAATSARGIGALMIVDRDRQRHQDRRPAGHREFGHGGGAGAGDHQMRRCQPRRHVGEERRQLRRDAAAA